MKQFKFETLYKKSNIEGKINEWNIEIEGSKYRTISGYTDGIKTTSEWTDCNSMNLGKKNSTTPEQQALKEAKSIYKKKIEKGFTDNIYNIHNSCIFFEPMLAENFKDYINDLPSNMCIQPKLDGVRCIINKNGMKTRNGKDIVACPHIFNHIKDIFLTYPDLVLDGELYNHILKNDFNKIISLVKKLKPTNEDIKLSADLIKYNIYDCSNDNLLNYSDRLKLLKSIEILNKDPFLLVDTFDIKTLNEINEYYNNYLNLGYEGIMIRNNLSTYQNKRTKNLLKYKPDYDSEYKIVGYEEGKGNRSGTIGAFICELEDGRTFNSNVKGNWEYLKQIWLNKDSYIGKMVTIKYCNLTPDGFPRFPYIIKFDK